MELEIVDATLGDLLRGLDDPSLTSDLTALETRTAEIREQALRRVVDARIEGSLAAHGNRYLNLATRKYISIGSYANRTVRVNLSEAASLLGMLVVRERSLKIDDESEYFCPVPISDEELEWLGKSAAAARTSEPVVWFHLECLRGTYQTLNYNPKENSPAAEYFKCLYQVYKAGKGLAELDFDPLLELWGRVKEDQSRFPDSWVCPATVILWAGFDEAEYASLPLSFDRFIVKRKKPVGIGFAYAYTFLRKARTGIGREACLYRLRQLEEVGDSTWAGLRTYIRTGLEAGEAPPDAPVVPEPDPRVDPVVPRVEREVVVRRTEAYERFCREVRRVDDDPRIDWLNVCRVFFEKQFPLRSVRDCVWIRTVHKRINQRHPSCVSGVNSFFEWYSWGMISVATGASDLMVGAVHMSAQNRDGLCPCASCRDQRGVLFENCVLSFPNLKDLFRERFRGCRHWTYL